MPCLGRAGLTKAGAGWLYANRLVTAKANKRRRGDNVCGTRTLSTAACPATAIKRQFLLQVHPDLLMSYPKERAINGENLKVLNNFLERDQAASRSLFSGRGSASPRDLVFYLKPQPPSSPSRVLVPLNESVFHRLSGILQKHCDLELQPPPPSGPQAPGPSPEEAWGGRGHNPHHYQNYHHSHHHQQQQQQQQKQQQQKQQQQQGEGWDYRGTRRRSAPPGPVVCLDTFLSTLAQAEKREATLQRRRAAAGQMHELKDMLKRDWGFASVDVVCEWGAEYLAKSLATLHAALVAHEAALRVKKGGFRGIDLVLTQHDIVRDVDVDVEEGRVLLCPSDPPTRWIETLIRVRARDVVHACELRHESELLTCAFQQSVLPGCVLERGLTCSHAHLRSMLRRTVSGLSARVGVEEAQGGVSRPWEQLRVRVEHGHRSRVLETGGLQLDSRTDYSDLHTLMIRLGARALRAQHEERAQDLILRELMEAARGASLQLLSVQKDVAITSQQAAACLSRLLLTQDRAIADALRGQALVIGQRGYGLSKEGALVLPWDWTTSTT